MSQIDRDNHLDFIDAPVSGGAGPNGSGLSAKICNNLLAAIR